MLAQECPTPAPVDIGELKRLLSEAEKARAVLAGKEICGPGRKLHDYAATVARFKKIAVNALSALISELEAGREALRLYEDALTEAEAIFGGEYADKYGPLFELAMKARDARALPAPPALGAQP